MYKSFWLVSKKSATNLMTFLKKVYNILKIVIILLENTVEPTLAQ